LSPQAAPPNRHKANPITAVKSASRFIKPYLLF
jgi:hypothetical protein